LSLLPPPDEFQLQGSQALDLGHGRTERRVLWALPVYDDFLNWPGARLMHRLERTIIHKSSGVLHPEVAYALSSLDVDSLTANDLLRLWRQHWHIENRVHYVRDVTMGEDACRVRTGNGPRALAALRNNVLTILRLQDVLNVAEALRTFAQFPYRALAQFVLP
jgi:predicted transposase YbfD/YdcC